MKILETLMKMAVGIAVPAGREQELGERLQEVGVPMSFIERGEGSYANLAWFVQEHIAAEPRAKCLVVECDIWVFVCQFNCTTLKATAKALRKFLGRQNLSSALLSDA